MEIKSGCKINIGLNIVSKRGDGYHDLESVFYPICGLYDEITLTKNDSDEVIFSSEGVHIDCPAEKNLCVKAARLMQERFNVGGLKIHLKKNIPLGAGLGGGSANATEILKGVNTLYNIGIADEQLAALAAELGSDTPFFVYDRPSFVQGRGEIIAPISLDLSDLWIVMVKPNIHVSTREAFAKATPQRWNTPINELIKEPIERWQGKITNDFEEVIFAQHPVLSTIKEGLKKTGALYCSMSGSGATVYGLYRSQSDAQKALELDFINSSLVTTPFKLGL